MVPPCVFETSPRSRLVRKSKIPSPVLAANPPSVSGLLNSRMQMRWMSPAGFAVSWKRSSRLSPPMFASIFLTTRPFTSRPRLMRWESPWASPLSSLCSSSTSSCTTLVPHLFHRLRFLYPSSPLSGSSTFSATASISSPSSLWS